MAIENERKYLVGNEPMDLTEWMYEEIEQGYLILDKKEGKQVRVRISKVTTPQWSEWTYQLTYKQDIDATKREEVEINIPELEAKELMELCMTKLTKKRWSTLYRPLIPESDRRQTSVVSVDEYPDGLKVIEVELLLDSSDEIIPHPYCGKDITGDKKYSNITIAKKQTDDTKKISNQ